MRWAYVLLLGACGHPSDAARDAPPATLARCAGPTFSSDLHLAVAQNCTGYSFSPAANLAVGVCASTNEVGTRWWIAEGPIDGSMKTVPLGNPAPNGALVEVRISPEGDRLAVRYTDNTTGANAGSLYQRSADGTWVQPVPITPLAAGDSIVGFSPRDSNRLLISHAGDLWELSEHLIDDWSEVQRTTYMQIGYPSLGHMRTSPDARVLTFNGNIPVTLATVGVYYMTRDDVSAPWTGAHELDSLPRALVDGVMTDDCGRFYMSTLNAVYYATPGYSQ